MSCLTLSILLRLVVHISLICVQLSFILKVTNLLHLFYIMVCILVLFRLGFIWGGPPERPSKTFLGLLSTSALYTLLFFIFLFFFFKLFYCVILDCVISK